jgi:hypothetical protein
MLIAALGLAVGGRSWAGDVLTFRNGDRLEGELLEANASGLRWRADNAAQPIWFATNFLAEVHLAPRPPRTARQLHELVVELTSGDRLTGKIVALDPKMLTLHTWYAGRLQVQRPAVKRLAYRSPEATIIYSGPTGPRDWQSVQTGWTYRQGKLYSQRNRYCAIIKDVGLPDLASIEFDVAWRGQPYWSVAFYLSPDVQRGWSGYQLSWNNNYLSLSRNTQGNQRNLESNVALGDRRRTQARVMIRVHKPRKTIAVYLDGALVRQWTDPGEFAGTGRALLFQSQGQSEIRLGNILVAEWDGKPDAPAEASGVLPADLVRLRNGDKVSGDLHTIAGGEVQLTNSFAAVRIPLSKISAIEFSGPTGGPTNALPGEVRAVLLGGAQIFLTLEQLDRRALTGLTTFAGRVVVPLDALLRLRFPAYAGMTEEDEWPTSAPQ